MEKHNFNELVALAMQQPGRSTMRPVVEKEILHYDIFYALDRAGLLRDLVFQGGTSLRLCRGSTRFSEDLDFAGGREFTSSKVEAIKACIETHIGNRYGLLVEVKPPKATARLVDSVGIKVDKWQISVETAPQQRDLPRQRIKIDIANVPAYSRELLPVRLNYDFLFGYGTLLVNVESIDEIMADKIVAYPASIKKVRHRDIWDLAWLAQQGARLDPTLVKNKVSDYGVENYRELLNDAIGRLSQVIKAKAFHDQMTRFLDAETLSRTLAHPEFLTYLIDVVGKLFMAMASHLKARPTTGSKSSFKM